MDSIIQEAIMSMSKAKDIAIVDCINDLIKRDILVFYDQRPTSEYSSDTHILTYKGACLLQESYRIRHLFKENEQLKAELTKIKGDYSRIETICAVKSTEIDILKSDLKYDINIKEISALKSKLKIASAALEVVKVHNGINAHYPIVYATVTQALRDVGEI